MQSREVSDVIHRESCVLNPSHRYFLAKVMKAEYLKKAEKLCARPLVPIGKWYGVSTTKANGERSVSIIQTSEPCCRSSVL